MKRLNALFIGSVVSLFIYWIIAIFYPELTSPILIVFNALEDLSMYLGYFGAFIVSLLGNATVLIPFPYIAVPFFMGNDPFNPWVTGIIAGIGAMIGEMTGYYIGYGGKVFMDENRTEGFHRFIQQYPRLTPLIIWFLALTPIPDDFFVVSLGTARYTWWKVFLPGVLGKTLFLTGIAWAGRLGLTWVELFLGGSGLISRTMEVVAIFLVILAIYLVMRIDWEKRTQSVILDGSD